MENHDNEYFRHEGQKENNQNDGSEEEFNIKKYTDKYAYDQ